MLRRLIIAIALIAAGRFGYQWFFEQHADTTTAWGTLRLFCGALAERNAGEMQRLCWGQAREDCMRVLEQVSRRGSPAQIIPKMGAPGEARVVRASIKCVQATGDVTPVMIVQIERDPRGHWWITQINIL